MAARNLCARKAIPNIEDAVSFLDGHGDADPGHIALLTDILRQIKDPSDQAAIILSAAVLRALYPRFFFIRREEGLTSAKPARCDRFQGNVTISSPSPARRSPARCRP
jgi:hypothetical protein